MSEEQTVLTSDNIETFSTCEIIPFRLPHLPHVTVHVKQLPVSDMKRIGKQLGKGWDTAELAQIELIAKSIVNPDGSPIYTDEKIKLLKTGNTPMFASLVVVVGKANQRADDQDEKDIDAYEKN